MTQSLNINAVSLSVSYVPVAGLKASPGNARLHPPAQIKRLKECIKTFGFLIPILVGKDRTIIAGHGRLEAAKSLGIGEVPVISVEHLNAAQERAFRVADNRLSELADWSPELLGEEFKFLMTVPDFDLTVTGFDIPQIDLLIQEAEDANDVEEEAISLNEKAISETGDLWQLGEHLILCADALEEQSYQWLLGEERAQQIITDPPYNVPVNRHICGLGKVRHNEFAMASGEMNQSEFTAFLHKVFAVMAQYSTDGSIHHIFMDWRHAQEILRAGTDVYSELKNLCVWNKSNGGMGALYRSKHELVFVFKHGHAAHINNIELGKHGRYRTNVWDYAGQNTLHANREDELSMHPTVGLHLRIQLRL